MKTKTVSRKASVFSLDKLCKLIGLNKRKSDGTRLSREDILSQAREHFISHTFQVCEVEYFASVGHTVNRKELAERKQVLCHMFGMAQCHTNHELFPSFDFAKIHEHMTKLVTESHQVGRVLELDDATNFVRHNLPIAA